MYEYILNLSLRNQLYDVECMNTFTQSIEFTQSFKKTRQESLVRIESTKMTIDLDTDLAESMQYQYGKKINR